MDRVQVVGQQIILKTEDDFLLTWVEAWLIDCRVKNLTKGSITYYREKIASFTNFCETQIITRIGEITPSYIRLWLLSLEEIGHNEGGRHGFYRTLRAFLNWYEQEAEPEAWKNPIRKVKPPILPKEPLEPVTVDKIKELIARCDKQTFTGSRDRAMIMCLLDTGARADEFLSLDLKDVNLVAGSVLIRQGKGRKPRTVFIGKQCRKAVRAYLKHRVDTCQAVWVTDEGERMKYNGLRSMLRRHASAAGIDEPTPHDFRRSFALMMLRGGTDIYDLAKLMGHSSIDVLHRYLKLDTSDVEAAHRKAGPVDAIGW